jgi:hypothetical protein
MLTIEIQVLDSLSAVLLPRCLITNLEIYNNNNNIYYMQMGRHPVAVVISHITYARIMKFDYSRFSWGGLHGKHVVATLKGKREPSQYLL